MWFMKTGVKVLDAMTKIPVVVDEAMALDKVAKIMVKNGVGNVIIKKGEKLQGILTEKDIVEKVVSQGLDPKKTTAGKIMSKQLVTIEPDVDIYEALKKMIDEDVRRLPVVHQGKFVGILTEKDILRISPELFDLLVDRISLREEDDKKHLLKELKKGKCEACGTNDRLYAVDDRLVCINCKTL